MMKLLLTFVYFLLLIYVSRGIQSSDNSVILQLRQRHDLDFFGDTRQLIVNLAGNLSKSAHEAVEAVGNFSITVQDETTLFVEKIKTDIDKFRGKIANAINAANDKLQATGELVTTCIESHRQEAETLIDNTFAKSKACADDRIHELDAMFDNLNAMSAEAMEDAANAVEGMRTCAGDGTENIFTVGSCLGTIVLQTQTGTAIFMARSGLLIARINFSIGTLPAAFEICAGTNMLEATIGTGRIVMGIGSCTASSIFTYFTTQSS